MTLSFPDESRLIEGDARYSARLARPEDSEELVRLFTRVFPRELQNGLALVKQVWEWKYGEPYGTSQSAVMSLDPFGQLVAHIGGIPTRTLVFGEARWTIQSVDNMVDANHRYRTTGIPIFSELLGAWWERCVLPFGAVTAWGFPTQLNHRVGARAAEYELIEHMRFLSRAASDGGVGRPSDACLTTVQRGTPGDVDALWDRCAPELGIALVRDKAYLDWRYQRHPSGVHRFVTCRDRRDGSLRGLAVVRPWSESRDLFAIVDWLVPQDDGEACAALIAAVEAEAARHGARTIGTWFPAPNPWARRFELMGFWSGRTRRPYVVRFATADLDLATMRAHLYATPGDADVN